MKDVLLKGVLSVAGSILGLFLLFKYYDWKLALAITLLLYANNLSSSIGNK